jgi:hypothetical protein
MLDRFDDGGRWELTSKVEGNAGIAKGTFSSGSNVMGETPGLGFGDAIVTTGHCARACESSGVGNGKEVEPGSAVCLDIRKRGRSGSEIRDPPESRQEVWSAYIDGFQMGAGKARGLGLGFNLDELGRMRLLWRRAQWREGNLWVE